METAPRMATTRIAADEDVRLAQHGGDAPSSHMGLSAWRLLRRPAQPGPDALARKADGRIAAWPTGTGEVAGLAVDLPDRRWCCLGAERLPGQPDDGRPRAGARCGDAPDAGHDLRDGTDDDDYRVAGVGVRRRFPPPSRPTVRSGGPGSRSAARRWRRSALDRLGLSMA